MDVPIVVPEIGIESLSAKVSCWLVELNENVLEGDQLVELIVPGMTFDVSSPAQGVISKIECVEGSPISVGQILGFIHVDSNVDNN